MIRILLSAVAVAAVSSGCQNHCGERYNNLVDPSWPERYNHVARLETLQPFQAQAVNGVTLGQTVWNYHFEVGSDKLTNAGQSTLDQFVQKRPAIDGRVYLQTTRDIGYDAATPEKYADTRRDLDERRAKAIQTYLAAQTASRPTAFEVQVIDPSNPAISARYSGAAVTALVGQYRANLGAGGGGSSSGGSSSSSSGGGSTGGR
ncbi:hypothetical protein BH11PLA2_BH11PLA2_11800 [soil metagenome]